MQTTDTKDADMEARRKRSAERDRIIARSKRLAAADRAARIADRKGVTER